MTTLKMKSTLGLFVAAAGLVLSASAFAGYVDLVVTGSGASTALEIESNDVKCGNDKHCIQTVKGQDMDLDFRLKKACKNGGPEYRLTEMQLSMVQRQPQSPGSNTMVKAFGIYVLPAIVTSDFGANASGIVQWTNHNKLADDKIKIKNKNHGEYVVFYQIKASKCPGSTVAGPADIYLDPRVRNTGR